MKVEIELTRVNAMSLKTKYDEKNDELITTISVEVKVHPGNLARLLYLQQNKAPLFLNIGSKQAEMDLSFTTFKPEKVENPPEKQATTPAVLPTAAKLQVIVDAPMDGKDPFSGEEYRKGTPLVLVSQEDFEKELEPQLKDAWVTPHFYDEIKEKFGFKVTASKAEDHGPGTDASRVVVASEGDTAFNQMASASQEHKPEEPPDNGSKPRGRPRKQSRLPV